MNINKQSTKVSILVLATALSSNTWAGETEDKLSASGLTPFTANTPAIAAEVNENNLKLLNKIEDLTTFSASVDCSINPDGLKNMIHRGAFHVLFTGPCNGPIWNSKRLSLEGSGKASSSINAVAVAGAEEIIWNRNTRLNIKNTTLNNSIFDVVIGSDQGSEVRLENVDIIGPGALVSIDGENSETTCLYTRQGSYRLTDVNISNCATGVSANYGSYIRAQGNTNITTTGAGVTFPFSVKHNSTIEIRDGVTANNGSTNAETEGAELVAMYSSSILLKGGSLDSVGVLMSSTVEMTGGTINDKLLVEGSSAHIKGGSFDASADIESTKSYLFLDNNIDINSLELISSSFVADKGMLTTDDLKLNSFSSLRFYGDLSHSLGSIRGDDSKISVHNNAAISSTCTSLDNISFENVSNNNLSTDQCN